MSSIWIDLDNAPHVPFFAPLIHEFQRQGHRTWVTVRDYGYTRNLMDRRSLHYDLLGRHPGKNRLMKVVGLMLRAGALVRYARGKKIDVAVSHGSRALVIACAILRVPCVTMYDYEFVFTQIFNRFSTKVMLPETFTDDVLASLSLHGDRVVRYPGLKEEIYLGDFSPDPSILERVGVDKDQIIATIRPPATSAHYHNPLSEKIMQAFMDRISAEGNVVGLVLPRTANQAEAVRKTLRNPDSFRILTRPVNGLNLIAHSDLVVGGGGTMNREAALLNVPVYSVFTGKVGIVDRSLVEEGKLILVRSVDDVSRVEFKKRHGSDHEENNQISEQCKHRKTRSADLIAFVTAEVLKSAQL